MRAFKLLKKITFSNTITVKDNHIRIKLIEDDEEDEDKLRNALKVWTNFIKNVNENKILT